MNKENQEEENKKPTGRPLSYTPELGDKICLLLTEGFSLRKICLEDEMPSKSTVLRWLVTEDPYLKPFQDQYARARKIQAECLVDEIFDIADDGSNDWMEREDKDGNSYFVINGEHIQRSRVRIDTRKWYAGKVLPKIYGDKVLNEVSGQDGNPIKIIISDKYEPEEFEKEYLDVDES